MKPEWERPDSIDDVEKFSELTDDELRDLVNRAFEKEMAYAGLKRLAMDEQRIRANERITFACVECGKKTNGYPGSPRVKVRKCRSCHSKEET